jgi:hypothetical protein
VHHTSTNLSKQEKSLVFFGENEFVVDKSFLEVGIQPAIIA